MEIAGTQGTLRRAGSTHTCGRNLPWVLGRRTLTFVEAPLKTGPPTVPGPGFLKPGGGPQSEKAQEVVPGELGSPAAQGLPGTRPPADFRPLWGSISSYVKRRNVTTDL